MTKREGNPERKGPNRRSATGPLPCVAVDWRQIMRGVGKTFITAGLLILLFVAYQLWGTGLSEARSQKALEKSFHAGRATTSAPDVSSDIPIISTTTAAPPVTLPPVGGAVGIIDI